MHKQQDFRNYINGKDSEERRAFFQGFLAAADAFGIDHPHYDEQEAQKWVLSQLVDYAIRDDEKKRAEAVKILQHFTYNKNDFRSMLLHHYVNDNGDGINAVGHPTDTPMAWPHFIAVMPDDGHEISVEEYERLDPEVQSSCTKVHYVELHYGNIVWAAREDNIFLMQEMIANDIKIGDPINAFYVRELLCKDGSLRHFLCESIHAAFMDVSAHCLTPEQIPFHNMQTAHLGGASPKRSAQYAAQYATRPYSFEEGDSPEPTARDHTCDGCGCSGNCNCGAQPSDDT